MLNIISGCGSLKKLKFVILKFKIKLEGATNRALNKTNNINISDILNTK